MQKQCHSVSQSVLCNLFRKSKAAWVTSLSHSFTHSLFSISPPLNLFLSHCLNPGVMAPWQPHKKKKKINKLTKVKAPFWSCNVGFLSRGAERGVFVRNESMCMNVCQFVNVWCTLQSDRWWAEGGDWEKFKNGVTDGLIAEAGLSHERYEKHS